MSFKGDIEISNDVWIGAHCVFLSGSKIGDGPVIAVNSVIRGEVPAYSIFGGVPGKFIKWRFDQTLIVQLISLKWWNWDIDKIKKNENFFLNQLSQQSIDEII